MHSLYKFENAFAHFFAGILTEECFTVFILYNYNVVFVIDLSYRKI